MKLFFNTLFIDSTYSREMEFPVIPEVGDTVSLWVYCEYYKFNVTNRSFSEAPGLVHINVQIAPMPLSRLQKPLQFEKDPNWKR